MSAASWLFFRNSHGVSQWMLFYCSFISINQLAALIGYFSRMNSKKNIHWDITNSFSFVLSDSSGVTWLGIPFVSQCDFLTGNADGSVRRIMVCQQNKTFATKWHFDTKVINLQESTTVARHLVFAKQKCNFWVAFCRPLSFFLKIQVPALDNCFCSFSNAMLGEGADTGRKAADPLADPRGAALLPRFF